MDLVLEIRNSFAEAKKNSAISISSLDTQYPAWVLRFDDWYGIGIPFEIETEISERFSNARLWTKQMVIGRTDVSLLLLTSTIESLRYEFASVCAQFIEPGSDGIERNNIINNPLDWWLRWKSLLGNSAMDKAVYSILGELLVFEKLILKGLSPTWAALNNATHDIEMKDNSYEVKSTINRYESIITINSQFQLQDTGKDLSLIFCRFEESEIGVSISDTVEKLVILGINRELLNDGLAKLGLEIGCSARTEKYKILELRKYKVDHTFPSITSKSFIDFKIPESIIQITYKVDLTNLKYDNWIDF